MTDLVKLARQRIDDQQRTHWEGCERDHRECLIQRMADEIERLHGDILRWRVAAQFALQAWEDGNYVNLEKAMDRIEEALK